MVVKKERAELNKKGQVYLTVRVIPGAAQTMIREVMADGTLKIAVAAAPERGRANQALIKYIAELFTVGQGDVKLISGSASRRKLLKITKDNK